MYELMCQTWANLVKNERATIEEVPINYQARVKEILNVGTASKSK